MSVVLTDLAAGHVFPPITFAITASDIAAYRAATSEALIAPPASAPPLAVAAIALGHLLREVNLPPGSLHSSETLEFHQPVPADSDIRCEARLVQRSNRSGWIASVLQSDLYRGDALAITTRATVLSPAT